MSKLIVEEVNTNTLKPKTGDKINIQGFINTGDVYDPREYGDLGDRVALQNAINACSNGTVYVPPYTWNITDGDLIIPEGVNLKVERGALFNIGNGRTFTCAGTIDAGKWHLFTWAGTGTINLRGCKTLDCPIQWWGGVEGTANDISAILLKAYQSLDIVTSGSPTTRSHNIVLSSGYWRIATPFEYVPAAGWTSTGYWLPNLIGEGQYGAVIYVDVGATNNGMTFGGLYGGSSRWIYGTWLKDLIFLGPPNSCLHALNIQCWNAGGGLDNVAANCGSARSAIFITSSENCHWDIKIGPGANKYSSANGYNSNYSGVEVAKIQGVGYSLGFGTYNYIKVHKTFSANEVYGLKISDSWGVVVDTATMEACGGGEIQSYYTNGQGPFLPLYPGSTTKVGHTFTLDETTTINGIHFGVNKSGAPRGLLYMRIYNTSGGAPTGSPIYTSWRTESSSEVNSGNGFTYYFPTAKLSLEVGIYFAAIEYEGTGDASNYVGASKGSYGFYVGKNPSTCYTWNGSAWIPQTFSVSHAINYGASLYLYNSNRIKVNRSHYESANPIIIDKCSDIEIEGAEGGAFVTRSRNINFTGATNLQYLYVDPYSWVNLNAMYSDNRHTAFETYGYVNFTGAVYNWNKATPPNVVGNGTQNLFHNTSLARWKTTPSIIPDGFTKSATQTWEKCGVGQSDTTRHPLAPYCAKLTESSPNFDMWYFNVTGDLLAACKGKWICWSIYFMVTPGTVFTTPPNFTGAGSYPAWQPYTQYNIGDIVGSSVCVEPGVSGGTQPVWPLYYSMLYTLDGSALWLACNLNNAAPMQISNVDMGGKWTRFAFNSYVGNNVTAYNFGCQSYGQASSPAITYFALPQLNFSPNPGIAPDFPSIAYFHPAKPLIIDGLFLSQDAYIPSNASSKLYGQYAIKGDRCKNNGAITTLTSGHANEWACTAESTTGTWAEVSRVP